MRRRIASRFSRAFVCVSALIVVARYATAQSDPSRISTILGEEILPAQVAEVEDAAKP